MRLRLKVLLILGCMWVLISGLIFIYSKSTLTNEYSKIEIKEVTDDLERTHKTLDTMFDSLKVLTFDWAQWDDDYRFMHDKNPAFIKSNLAFTTFENAKINLILFFDSAGKFFYGMNYDLGKKKFLPIPNNLITYLQAEKSLAKNPSTMGTIGILRVPLGYIVLCAQPILTSEGKGPSAGTLVMGYYFNEQHLAQLSNIVKMHVGLYPLPIPANNPDLQKVFEQLRNNGQSFITPQSKEIIAGYTFIKDIDKHPIAILQIEEPRILYLEGLKTIDRYIGIVIFIGLLFLFSIWFLLKIFVLDRIISVSKQVIDINSESKFAKRIHISGKDELFDMVSALNSMLEIISLSEEQLKNRIYLRTEELERLSNLNKNLYHEMNHQRQIENQLREGEKLLRHLAYYDDLTGLPNRLFFNEMLQKVIAKTLADDSGLAILYLDANKFKNINDTFGHDVGDKYLKHAAQQLKLSIRLTDIAARLSGDEFIVCLTNVRSKPYIANVAEKILANMTQPVYIDSLELSSTFSMGICILPEDGITVEELERNADIAMYYAKKQQTSTFCFYDEIQKDISV